MAWSRLSADLCSPTPWLSSAWGCRCGPTTSTTIPRLRAEHIRWCSCCLRVNATRRALCSPGPCELTQPGGRILACISNNEGARSGEADLERIAGPVTTLTKNKCRAFWSGPLDGPHDAALAEQWAQLDAVRPIGDGRFVSRPGVFAWDRIDVASALLAAHLPPDLAGRAADLGAGFGYLGVELLERCAGIAALDVYEAEHRALDLARRNLAAFEQRCAIRYCWRDVTAGLTGSYETIVCNPPFHTHARTDRPDIGRRFIAAAAEALQPRGRLWLVANRHLPYERALGAGFRARPHREAAARLQDRRSCEGAAQVKLLKLIANLGYGSRKEVTAMFRDGRITDVDGRQLSVDDAVGAAARADRR